MTVTCYCLGEHHPVLVVALAAAIAPIAAHHTRGLRIPVVVFEILLGVLVGPQVLNWVDLEGPLPYELGPMLLLGVLMAKEHGVGAQLGFETLFGILVIGVLWASLSLRPPGLLLILRRTMTKSGQLPIRLWLLLIAALVDAVHAHAAPGPKRRKNRCSILALRREAHPAT